MLICSCILFWTNSDATNWQNLKNHSKSICDFHTDPFRYPILVLGCFQVDLHFIYLFIFYKKNILARLTPLSLFPPYFPFTLTYFTRVLASYWHRQHKIFYPDCVISSGQRVTVYNQPEISVLLGAHSWVQTNEDHWELRKKSEM